MGRQGRLTFEEEHFRCDLVFYNHLLKCFVLFDLKIGELKHQDIGQMQMYVNFHNRNVISGFGRRSLYRYWKGIRDIEKTENSCQEYDNRIKDDIRHTLKECGGEGKTFSEEQKKLMVWYTYFFLNRGKPSTHIEALSMINDNNLVSNMPDVFKRVFSTAEKVLQEKALVSKCDTNAVKHRPAVPFGVVLKMGCWCCFGENGLYFAVVERFWWCFRRCRRKLYRNCKILR